MWPQAQQDLRPLTRSPASAPSAFLFSDLVVTVSWTGCPRETTVRWQPPGHSWRSPDHTTALPNLLPAGACNLGTHVHTARPAGLQNEEPVWQMVLPEASTSSCMGGLAHHCHVGRLLARWLPWVPGKLLVTVMSSWEHGHQVAGERVTRGTCCVYSVVTELVLGLQGPVRDPGLTCTSGLLVPSLWGSPGVMRWGVVPDLSDLGKLRELWTLVSRLFTRFYFKCRISPYPAGCDSGAKASGNSRRFRSPG